MKTKDQETTVRKAQSSKYIPWLFGLEVGDLANPITIRRLRILQIVVLLAMLSGASYLLWENTFRAPTGAELVSQMVTAAGGMQAWNHLKSGQFTRTQNVYDKSGKRLSHHVETFYFRKNENGIQIMVKAIDRQGKEVVISKDNEGFWATKQEIPADPKGSSKDLGMMCDSEFCQPDCAATMAFYRFSMPFKLTDSGVNPAVNNVSSLGLLDWNPLENMTIEGDPLILDISFDPSVGRDKWRFMVNPETSLIHKIEYYNKSDFGTYRPEEIYWSDHKTVNGVTFSHRWTKYWSNGQVMDEYIYSDVSLNNQLDEAFFKRPENLDWVSINNNL